MSAQPGPTFSVVMPTHNRGRGIEPAVRSVLAQTRPVEELIIVDDASQPRAIDAVPWLASEPRVRYEYLPVNRGVSAARNVGIRTARGEFVSFLDDDDLFAPGKLEALSAAIQDDEADVLYHAMRVQLVREGFAYDTDPETRPFHTWDLLVKNVLDAGISMVTARRSCLLEVGGFDEGLPALEDHELLIRMHLAGHRFRFVGGVLADYIRRTNEGSKTLSLANDLRAWDIIHLKHAAAYAELPPAMRADHEQKVEQYRAARCLAAYRRTMAAGYFIRAFRRRPSFTSAPLLGAALASVLSPRLTMILQGALKRSRLTRAVHRPAVSSSPAIRDGTGAGPRPR